MFSDLRHAFRSLAKSPGFVVVAALTLALGIGANTTFFSVLHGVVLRGLPFPEAENLVEIQNVGPVLGANDGRISLAELRDYRAGQRSFVGIGAYTIGRATLSSDEGAERVIQTRVSANLLPLLGIAPSLGRGFEESEERAGHDRVVVISHAFWQTHLAGAPDVLGRTIRLNAIAHTIVGVMPAGFAFAEPGTAIWKPFDFSSRGAADRTDRSLSAVARLAPGATLAAARADLDRLARELQANSPVAYPADAQWNLSVTPLRASHFGHMFRPLALLMVAATAVLLIACVNVAIMFLLRAAVRRRDFMIRLSLGAGRRHIVRQLLAETSLICALGAIGGGLLAAFGIQLVKAFPPSDIPRLHEIALNVPVAAFMAGVLVLVTLLVGLTPALVVLRTRISEGITASARSTETRSAVRLREALTVVEIALAVMLLVCGGLAVRSLSELLRDDVGFATSDLFTFKTNLTPQAYPTLQHANRFYDQLTTKLEALPGVTAVAAVSYLPLSGESDFAAAVPLSGAPAVDGDARPGSVAWRVVRGPYFRTMGLRLLAGRYFNSSDSAGAPLVAIVDDEFARRLWADPAAALGQSVRFGTGANAQTRTIVGIVHRVKHTGPGKFPVPEAYVPHAQFYQRGMYTVVKTTGDAAALAPLIRAQLAAVDPTVPMYFVDTMERRYANTLALPRFTAGLIGAFSSLALLLAGVGIFGVTAYSVSQRSREFGIRFAIGASRSHVGALVLGRVARLALLGAAIGAFAAYHVAQLMAGLLFGVDPADLPSLAAAAIIIALTALAASVVPLFRALRVNPADALRAE